MYTCFMNIIRTLETFCAIIETRSFSSAANRMFLSQPSISTQIKELEKYYGTTLVNRSRERITPTDSGKLLYRYAKELIRLAQKTRNVIDDLKNLLRGEIRLGASTVPGTYLLPAVVKRFKNEHHGIEISLRIGDTSIIIKDVFDRLVDFGIVGEKTRKQGLNFQKLMNDNIVLIAPTSMKRKRISLEELTEIPLIFREIGSGTRLAVVQVLAKKKLLAKKLNTVIEMGSTEAVKQAVIAGIGASFVSEITIKNELKLGLIKKVEIPGLKIQRHFWLVKRSGETTNRASTALYNFIRSRNLQ